MTRFFKDRNKKMIMIEISESHSRVEKIPQNGFYSVMPLS